MSNLFLAEDFRNLLNTLENINEEDTEKDVEKHTDVDDLMTTSRPKGIDKTSVKNIYDLIEFLDQFPELAQYKNPNASYDDAFYEQIPVDELESVTGITPEDLKNIADNTDAYEGDYLIVNNEVSVFGGD